MSAVLYQFLQSLMMLSPGFADCQSEPPGHAHDALLESGSENVVAVSKSKEKKTHLIRLISVLAKWL